MQKLIAGLAVGVITIFGVSAGFALVQQMTRQFTLQSLAGNDISVEQALLVAQGALDACKKDNSVITVAVVDHVGGVRFIVRGDGASPEMVDNARRKAYTARTFRRSSLEWAKRSEEPAFAGQRSLADVIALGGGLPIAVGDDTIGGVGVSGAPGQEKDEACARAALAKVADQLK